MTVYEVGASATYHEEGDMVLVTLYLLDPTVGDGVYKPQLVKNATCTLFSGDTPIDSVVEFDRRNGTQDGSFQIFFIHPSSLHHLKTKMSLVVIDGTNEDTYDYETHVIRVEAEDMGLAAQPPEDMVY